MVRLRHSLGEERWPFDWLRVTQGRVFLSSPEREVLRQRVCADLRMSKEGELNNVADKSDPPHNGNNPDTAPGTGRGQVTMADVARFADVSTATVSRVIHGASKVREKTRVKVQQAIDALGYAPNIAAQQLAAGRADVIGVIVNTIENPVSAQVVQGIEEEVSEGGYRLLLSNSHYDADIESRLIRTYISLGISGIIVLGSWCTRAFFKELPPDIPPIALINPEGDEATSFGLPTITIDGLVGGRLAGQHLIELGHSRIGFVGRKPLGGELQRARQEGLRQALQEAGLDLDRAFVAAGNGLSIDAGTLGIRQLLSRNSLLPTAILCYHDLTAYGAIQELNEAGLRVPEDMSVVGFDDIFTSRFLSLTTLSQPFADMGKLAAQIILESLMSQGQMRLANIQVLPTLEVRGSTCRLERTTPDD